VEETGPIDSFIREMLPEEKGAVEKLFARSLGIVDRIGFGLSFEDKRA
jgi:hypothetical protein